MELGDVAHHQHDEIAPLHTEIDQALSDACDLVGNLIEGPPDEFLAVQPLHEGVRPSGGDRCDKFGEHRAAAHQRPQLFVG